MSGEAEEKPRDETLIQPEEAQEGSKELSVPSGVEQHASAPKIPGYVLTNPLGQGAFAEVWKGWQVRTRKWVAVKVFTQRKGVNWLFLQREVERLIRLDRHPNIVSLLDADLTGDPPWYAMDYMEGGSLETVMEDGRMPPLDQVTRWMNEVAEALRFVHAKGLIHCDLKPANILIDSEGRARVADFGQSRIVTESTGALGTLFYMAPEQAVTDEEVSDVTPDVRWDLYGLGTTFTAVLTGKTPRGESRGELESAEGLGPRLKAYRRLVESSPLPALRAATAQRVDEDLSAIVGKLLEPVPENRYPSIDALITDLDARRDRLPVAPLAANPWYRFKRFVQRNAIVVAVATVCAAGLAYSYAQVLQKNARIASQKLALENQLSRSYQVRARAAADQGQRGEAAVLFAKANEIRPSRAAAAGALAHIGALATPERAWNLKAAIDAVAISPDGERALVSSDNEAMLYDLRSGLEIGSRSAGSTLMLRAISIGADAHDLAFTADGRRALARVSGGVRLLDPKNGKTVAKVPGTFAAFSPDGKVFATSDDEKPGPAASGEYPKSVKTAGNIQLYSAEDGRHLATMAHPVKNKYDHPPIAFSPDSRLLLSALEGKMRLWNAKTGAAAGGFEYDAENKMLINPLETAMFSPDGSKILSVTWRRARLYDAKTGKPFGLPMRHDEKNITVAVFSPNGRFVATGGEDGKARIWNATGNTRSINTDEAIAAGSLYRGPVEHADEVTAVAFSPDSKLLATASLDGTVRLWSFDDRLRPVGRVFDHGTAVLSLAFSENGGKLLTGTRDGVARLWTTAESGGSTFVSFPDASSALFSPDGSRVFARNYKRGVYIADTKTLEPIGGYAPGPQFSSKDQFSADGSALLTLYNDSKDAWIWDSKAGKRVVHLQLDDFIYSAALSPDGALAATAGKDGRVVIWDARTGKTLGETRYDGFTFDLAFSPNGGSLAAADGEETRIWSVARILKSGAEPAPPALSKTGGWTVAWTPDGKRIAVSHGMKNRAGVIDAATGERLGDWIVHEGRINHLAISPDGGRIVTVSADGTARLMDARTGRAVGAPLKHYGEVHTAAFTPDGTVFVTGDGEGRLRFWTAERGDPIGPVLKQDRYATDALFIDGTTLLTRGPWGYHRWSLDWLEPKIEPSELTDWAERASQRRVDHEGVVQRIENPSFQSPPESSVEDDPLKAARAILAPTAGVVEKESE